MLRRYSQVVLSIATAFAFISSSGVLWAQNCGDLPPRGEVSQLRLAVKLSGSWKLFEPNTTNPTNVISTNQEIRKLCLAWEAPPYPHIHKQIVYASTQYREDQPVWLWRNNAFQIPFYGALLGNWNRTPDSSKQQPVEAFKEFHSNLPQETGMVPWRDMADWHDTSAWLPNQSSFDLVSTTLNEVKGSLPLGTERLISLKALRPFSSWVQFTTYMPERGGQLHVAVAFSGDMDDQGPMVYRYKFKIQ